MIYPGYDAIKFARSDLQVIFKKSSYLRANVPNGETCRGNSQKTNSAHILKLGRP